MEPTEAFSKQVREAWSNSPHAVAEAGMNELFRHPDDFDLDHDDQVRYAMEIGIIAGQLYGRFSPEFFIAVFVEKILNKEPDEA